MAAIPGVQPLIRHHGRNVKSNRQPSVNGPPVRQSAGPPVRRPAGGFTLVEVVVVLVLLGVVAGVTLPALRDWTPATPLDSATDQVVRLFRSARAEALHRGVETRLFLDPSHKSYRIELDSADGAPIVHEGRLNLPEGVEIRGAAARLRYRFTASGTAFGDTVWVSDQGGSRRVTVDQWTGDPDAQ